MFSADGSTARAASIAPPPDPALLDAHTENTHRRPGAYDGCRQIAFDSPRVAVVSEQDDKLEIASAAWQILSNSGGLMNRADIAERFGLTPSRVWHLVQQRHFPAPVGEVGGRPVWLTAAVEAYRASPPPVGRPPKDVSTA